MEMLKHDEELYNIILNEICGGDVSKFCYNDIKDEVILYRDNITYAIGKNRLLIIFSTDIEDEYIQIEYIYKYGDSKYKFESIRHNNKSDVKSDIYIAKADEYLLMHSFNIYICRKFVLSMVRKKDMMYY